MTRSLFWLALVTSIPCFACTPAEKPDALDKNGENKAEPTVKTVEHVDVGTACVSGTLDQPHEINVDFGICLSSSCDELVSSSCTVEQTDTELKVTATATVRSDAGPNGVCSTDCGRVGAVCTTASALVAGTYKLSYAGKQVEVTVPRDGEPTCTPP